MKAIILAAGYATRLYPLTKNQPKPLLEIAGQTILDFILNKIERVPAIDEIYIVTNNKFASHFQKFIAKNHYRKEIKVVNDGTMSNDDRLGAIGDIYFTIQSETVADDLLIVAGDNLFGFDLKEMWAYFDEKGKNVIAVYREPDVDQLVRGGTAQLDRHGRVIGFEEKPKEPKYPYSVPTFYMIQQSDIELFGQYLAEGHDADANGHFIPYLMKYSDVFGFEFTEYRYDIGTIENYQHVRELFK